MSWLEKLLPPRIQRSDASTRRSVPEGLWVKCPSCEAVLYRTDLETNQHVCPKCDHHMRIPARRRLDVFLDKDGIINELVLHDGNYTPPWKVNEFKYIKEIMDFDKKCHEIFRNWYIDGRVYYQKVINTAQPKKGLQELRYIDPRKIRKVREVIKEKNNDNNMKKLAQVITMLN